MDPNSQLELLEVKEETNVSADETRVKITPTEKSKLIQRLLKKRQTAAVKEVIKALKKLKALQTEEDKLTSDSSKIESDCSSESDSDSSADTCSCSSVSLYSSDYFAGSGCNSADEDGMNCCCLDCRDSD